MPAGARQKAPAPRGQAAARGPAAAGGGSDPTAAEGGSDPAAAGGGSDPVVPAARDSTNSNHFDNLQQAIDKIYAHPVMQDIREAPPIARGGQDPRTGKTGYKEIFDPALVAADLKSAGTSEMAGNFFWQNSFVSPLAGVPIQHLRERALAGHLGICVVVHLF